MTDVTANFDDPAAEVLGTEFVGTSISSGAPAALGAAVPLILANNPHVKWADATKRGWVRCEVTSDVWRADYRLVDNNTRRGLPGQHRDLVGDRERRPGPTGVTSAT